ncbi:hypothetical protein [Laspinema palackyanum]|uniref:hypothetical protein n=1 Tax=Laspinema palackyanum TaxID=3231601 RepID=UPI00345C8325|nr:hypothetical protein [Laspinema sp. D2c]
MESIVKFIVSTPLGFTVRTNENYWQTLLIKHPDIAHYETEIQQTLNQPEAIYQSQRDINVLLFYRTLKAKWRGLFDYSLPN